MVGREPLWHTHLFCFHKRKWPGQAEMPKTLVQKALDGSAPGPVPRVDVRRHSRMYPRMEEHNAKGKAGRKGKAAQRTSPPAMKKKKVARSVLAQQRAAETRVALKRAPRQTPLDPPDSCGKAGNPHDLEVGALAKSLGHISKKHRRSLDSRLLGAAAAAGAD